MALTLRFSGSSNIAAMAVKIDTWSWASHSETLIEPDDLSALGQILPPGTQPRLYGALPGTGVGFRPMNATVGDRVEQYTIQMHDQTKYTIIKHLLAQQGKPYDWTGIIGFALHRNWNNDDTKWFCSELIAWAFEQSGFPLLRTDQVNKLAPATLLLSPYLEPIT
jgi:hypothetical protein